MNTLTSQIEQLQSLAHELLYLGVDGAPIYTDHFRQLNKEVLEQSDALYPQRGATPEEEANICLALLMVTMQPSIIRVTRRRKSKLFSIVVGTCLTNFLLLY